VDTTYRRNALWRAAILVSSCSAEALTSGWSPVNATAHQHAICCFLIAKCLPLYAGVLPAVLQSLQHNVRLSLTYLDVEKGEGYGPAVTAKTEALIKSAMEPVKLYT
jgi:hypothetical protein